MTYKNNSTPAEGETTRILVADDDSVSLRVLQKMLEKWGHEVVVAKDGTEAWQVLTAPEAPGLAVLDWMMPGMAGATICRRVREIPLDPSPYLILLTARNDSADIVTGLESGANDYVTKPFHHAELRARVHVGLRVLDLQNRLAQRVQELEMALKQVKHLHGLLPICMYCKKIRNDKDYWQQVEAYISERTDAEFSHGICPECYKKFLQSQAE